MFIGGLATDRSSNAAEARPLVMLVGDQVTDP